MTTVVPASADPSIPTSRLMSIDYKNTINLPKTDFAMKADLAQARTRHAGRLGSKHRYEEIQRARGGSRARVHPARWSAVCERRRSISVTRSTRSSRTSWSSRRCSRAFARRMCRVGIATACRSKSRSRKKSARSARRSMPPTFRAKCREYATQADRSAAHRFQAPRRAWRLGASVSHDGFPIRSGHDPRAGEDRCERPRHARFQAGVLVFRLRLGTGRGRDRISGQAIAGDRCRLRRDRSESARGEIRREGRRRRYRRGADLDDDAVDAAGERCGDAGSGARLRAGRRSAARRQARAARACRSAGGEGACALWTGEREGLGTAQRRGSCFSPSPSRGGPGRGRCRRRLRCETHPRPNPPLEGEGFRANGSRAAASVLRPRNPDHPRRSRLGRGRHRRGAHRAGPRRRRLRGRPEIWIGGEIFRGGIESGRRQWRLSCRRRRSSPASSSGKPTTRSSTLLRERGVLLADAKITHSYPHCWRHKTPVAFRTTPQWFIGMEQKGLRTARIEDDPRRCRWFPAWGEERIAGMVEGRPDWCISRQRTWGVPIALFVAQGRIASRIRAASS